MQDVILRPAATRYATGAASYRCGVIAHVGYSSPEHTTAEISLGVAAPRPRLRIRMA